MRGVSSTSKPNGSVAGIWMMSAVSCIKSHWRLILGVVTALIILWLSVQLFLPLFLTDYLIGTLCSVFGISPFLARALRYLLLIPLGIVAAFLFRPGKIKLGLTVILLYLAVCNLFFYFLSVATIPREIDYQTALSRAFFGKTIDDVKTWYSQNDTGEYTLFDSPGVNRAGKPLLPVTPEVAPRILAAIESAVKHEKKTTYITPLSAKHKVCCCFINYDVGIVSSQLANQGIKASTIFSQRFIEEGNFNAIFSNDIRILKELGVGDCCEYLLIGKVEMASSISKELEHLITTSASGTFRLITLSDFQMTDFRLASKGVGFSHAKSENEATEQLSQELISKVVPLLK